MAYMCIYNHNYQCDGCGDCDVSSEYKPDKRWDIETDRDEEVIRMAEKEEQYDR